MADIENCLDADVGHLTIPWSGVATGHLTKDATGHLRKRGNLESSYWLTFAGLAGDFATYNGSWEVDYDSINGYWDDADFSGVLLRLERFEIITRFWSARLEDAADCSFQMRGDYYEEGLCDPILTMSTFVSCTDSGCTDTDSCEDSASATCEVTKENPSP